VTGVHNQNSSIKIN